MNVIENIDCLLGIKNLQDESIDCVVTSPPYYGLRNYENDNQIGIEESPDLYIKKLTEIFYEIKRILKNSGTLWVNISDTYINKSLALIPYQFIIEMKKLGYIIRNDIIWNKPNFMPESVNDRCTRSHEYIFMFTKSKDYYFDNESIKENSISINDKRLNKGNIKYEGKRTTNNKSMAQHSFVTINEKKNKRTVWTIPTKPIKENHFATYPQELIVDCIKSGCPINGIVLDPFMGSGTTAIVAKKLNRNYIGFELNEDFIKIANKRLFDEFGLFINK